MKMPNSIKYKPTIILIALNIAVYIYTSAVGGDWLSTNFNGIPPLYQLNGDSVFYTGAYYQLFTSMFVHASIAHIGGNMLFLIYFRFKSRRNVLLYPNTLESVYIGGGLSRQRSLFGFRTGAYSQLGLQVQSSRYLVQL
jgi:hypothetical protein